MKNLRMSFATRNIGSHLIHSVLYDMVKQTLGNRSIKCVLDDDEYIFTSDMETLLSCLDLEHPFGELVYQTLKSHKEKFGDGVRTCMFMITRIAKAISQLEDLGINNNTSLAVIRDVINLLTHQVQQISIAIDSSAHYTVTNEKRTTFFPNLSFPQNASSNLNNIYCPPSKLVCKTSCDFLEDLETGMGCLSFDDPSLSTIEKQINKHNYGEIISNSKFVNNGISSNICCETSSKMNVSQPSNKLSQPITEHHHVSTNVEFFTKDIMESDPVILKMSDVSQEQKNEDDIDWFFNENPKNQNCPDFSLIADLETDKETVNCGSNPSLTVSNCQVQTGKLQETNKNSENDRNEKDSVKERRHLNITHENQHDSDFEDCFDDLENRKQVVVVVERMEDLEDFSSNNNLLKLCQDKSTDTRTRMAHNIQQHFGSTEFEAISSVPSLHDSRFDKEFDDCFDPDPLSSSSRDPSCILPLKSAPGTLHDFECGSNKIHPINLVSSSFSKESMLKAKVVNSLSFSSNQCSQMSELDKLNSILSSISTQKSHNVQAILVSSRHNLDESNLTKCNGIIDVRKGGDSKDDSSHGVLQSKTNDVSKGENCGINKTSIEGVATPLSDEVQSQVMVTTVLKATPSLRTTHQSELEKLNSVLQSLNRKKSSAKKTQIFLSSRHDLDEYVVAENSQHHFTSSLPESVTIENQAKVSHGIPQFCKEFVLPDGIDEKPGSELTNINPKQSELCRGPLQNYYDSHSLTEENSSICFPESNLSIFPTDASVVDFKPKPECERDLKFLDSYSPHQLSLRVNSVLSSSVNGHDQGFVNHNRAELTDLTMNAIQHESSEDFQSRELCHTTHKSSFSIPHDLHTLARDHGDMVELISRLCCSSTNTQENKGLKRLNLHLTHCVSLQSPKSSKTIVDGLVIPCRSRHLDALRCQFGHHLNVLLVNGDLTPTHCHKGFKPTIAKKNLIKSSTEIGSPGKDALWAHRIVECLKQLRVAVVLIRGNTTSVMEDNCMSSGIFLLTNTKHHSLNIISHQLKTDMMCYAEDAIQENVCQLCFQPLDPSWMDKIDEDHCLVVSNLKDVKSVVLSEPCALSAQTSEENFWKYFHRVSNSLDDGVVLPGSGVAEIWCYERIRQMASSFSDSKHSDQQLLRTTILESLADVFYDFADTVHQNTENQLDRQQHMHKHFEDSSQEISSLSDSDIARLSGPLPQNIGRKIAKRDITDDKGDVQPSNYESITGITTESENLARKTRKTYCCSNSNRIGNCHYDSYSSKTSAWRSAIDVVSVLSSIDSLIITGAAQNDLIPSDVVL